MPNDLPAIKILDDTAILPADQWDDLICRLTVAEGRLAAHHGATYDAGCRVCDQVVKL